MMRNGYNVKGIGRAEFVTGVLVDLVLLAIYTQTFYLGVGVVNCGFLVLGGGLETEGQLVNAMFDISLDIFGITLWLNFEANPRFQLDPERVD